MLSIVLISSALMSVAGWNRDIAVLISRTTSGVRTMEQRWALMDLRPTRRAVHVEVIRVYLGCLYHETTFYSLLKADLYIYKLSGLIGVLCMYIYI